MGENSVVGTPVLDRTGSPLTFQLPAGQTVSSPTFSKRERIGLVEELLINIVLWRPSIVTSICV